MELCPIIQLTFLHAQTLCTFLQLKKFTLHTIYLYQDHVLKLEKTASIVEGRFSGIACLVRSKVRQA